MIRAVCHGFLGRSARRGSSHTRGRELYLEDLDRLQALGVFPRRSGRAALVKIGLYAAVKGGEGVGSSIWARMTPWKLC